MAIVEGIIQATVVIPVREVALLVTEGATIVTEGVTTMVVVVVVKEGGSTTVVSNVVVTGAGPGSKDRTGSREVERIILLCQLRVR